MGRQKILKWIIASIPRNKKSKWSPWSRVLVEELVVTQLVKKLPVFYGIRKLITIFTRACHWSLSWARCIQSKSSQPIFLRSILTPYSHLRLVLLNSLFLSCFRTRILNVFLISPMSDTWPVHLILHDLISLIKFGKVYKLRSSSLYSHLQPPATSSLLGSYILLSTLFSNTLNIHSSLRVKDQVSHPYETTQILIFILIRTVICVKVFHKEQAFYICNRILCCETSCGKQNMLWWLHNF
jgi:hypothetical protein